MRETRSIPCRGVLVLPAGLLQAAAPRGREDPLPRAHVSLHSFRITDNSDHDVFADPKETVGRYVALRSGNGVARTNIVRGLDTSDPDVTCIDTPSAFFGNLAAGQVAESPTPLTFRIGSVARTSPEGDRSANVWITIVGDGFQAPPQRVDAGPGPRRDRRARSHHRHQ